MLVKEREAAIKVTEKVPVIQEVPVVDHVALEKLTIENEKLKVRRVDSQGSLFCLMMPTFISLHEVKASQKFSPILGWITCEFVFANLIIFMWLISGSGNITGKENWWNREKIRRDKQNKWGKIEASFGGRIKNSWIEDCYA